MPCRAFLLQLERLPTEKHPFLSINIFKRTESRERAVYAVKIMVNKQLRIHFGEEFLEKTATIMFFDKVYRAVVAKVIVDSTKVMPPCA